RNRQEIHFAQMSWICLIQDLPSLGFEGMCHEFEQLLQNGNLYCNRDIDPVFGPDGKTHTNKCVMCALPRAVGTGPSDLNCFHRTSFCPYIIKQVCGTDGKTYSNECEICRHNLETGENVGKKFNGKCSKVSEL
uniref:Kazal-like domain-containing protein n=1 Tax=Varanus komodoensis TaxID=61221 RepID=A0A8D2LJJ3_VARKO